jgi:hypothetical protein
LGESIRQARESARGYRFVASVNGAAALAGRCLRHARNIAIVTRLDGSVWPFDPQRLADALPGVDVYAVENGQALDELNRMLGYRLVYGGATRLFTADGRSRYWQRIVGLPRLIRGIDECLHGRERGEMSLRDGRRLEKRVAMLQAERDRLRKRLKDAQTFDPAGLFEDPAEQLGFEIRLAWARGVPASAKTSRPLAAYRLGEGFIDSAGQYEATVPRSLLVRAIVDVLDGAVAGSTKRRRHALRESLASDAPPRLGQWGRPVMRVDVTKSHGFRLHYTTDNEGRIVLLGLHPHDENL